MRSKRSGIWKLSDEYIQEILDTSNTMSEVCRRLDVSASNGSSRTVHSRIAGLSLDKFQANHKAYKLSLTLGRSLTHAEIFTEDSTIPRKTVRKVVLRDNLIPYTCSLCPIGPEWNGKALSLQLDHVNGINNDNRIDNLRFVCPNCHSQTPTFAGKNNKK